MGAAHPDELRKRLNSRQIAEWIAYANIEPFGSQHDELLHGIRCALFAAAHRSEGSEPPQITDFMPSYETPQMTEEEIIRNIRAWKGMADGDG